jgi:hypothetical protein
MADQVSFPAIDLAARLEDIGAEIRSAIDAATDNRVNSNERETAHAT